MLSVQSTWISECKLLLFLFVFEHHESFSKSNKIIDGTERILCPSHTHTSTDHVHVHIKYIRNEERLLACGWKVCERKREKKTTDHLKMAVVNVKANNKINKIYWKLGAIQ